MEDEAIGVGKTTPARKLLSMLGRHSLKDPSFAEQLWEAKFTSLTVDGASLQGLLEFSGFWYDLLGEAPVNLWNAQQVQRKYMAEVRKCSHPQVKKD